MKMLGLIKEMWEKIPFFLVKSVLITFEILFSVYLNIESFEYDANFILHHKEMKSNIFKSVCLRTTSYILLFVLNFNLKEIVTKANQIAFKAFFLEYLSLDLTEIKKLGNCNIMDLIAQRSKGFSEAINILGSFLVPKIFFICIFIYNMKFYLSWKDFSIVVLPLILIGGSFIAIQKKKRKLKRTLNTAMIDSDTQRIEILNNYERAIAYGTLEEDMINYKIKTYHYTSSINMYAFLYNTLEFIIGCSLLTFFYFIWLYLKTHGDLTKEKFCLIVLLTERFKSTLYYFIKDVDKFSVHILSTKYSGYNDSVARSWEKLNSGGAYTRISGFKDKIEIKNLSTTCKYADLLKNINFSIKKNDKIAIFGPSGSGKSLFLTILLGKLEYDGEILIDGININNIHETNLIDVISYVSQNTGIFNRTILQNLLSCTDEIDLNDLYNICRDFNCHHIFKELGYEKQVGKKGSHLSGGQRQRILILRSILRNKDILVLDSPFKGLDQKSEIEFIEGFKTNLKDKTVICVTQNTQTLHLFDKIIFFNDGQANLGTFANLIQQPLILKKLWYSTRQRMISKPASFSRFRRIKVKKTV